MHTNRGQHTLINLYSPTPPSSSSGFDFTTKHIRHFMDKAGLGKEAPEEVTRESLIAISYSLPEKNLTSKLSSGKLNGDAIDTDGEEKFRSELISISYTESPEVGGLPVTMGELNG